MTSLIRPTRRGIIMGVASLITAPAIVRVASIMPIRVQPSVFLGVYVEGDGTWWPITDPAELYDNSNLGKQFLSYHRAG